MHPIPPVRAVCSNDCSPVMITADAPVEDCWENWNETIPQMDPIYKGVFLDGEFTYRQVRMILARKRTQRILVFGKRDFVFLVYRINPSLGRRLQPTVSTSTEG
jgi:hypothetical protein